MLSNVYGALRSNLGMSDPNYDQFIKQDQQPALASPFLSTRLDTEEQGAMDYVTGGKREQSPLPPPETYLPTKERAAQIAKEPKVETDIWKNVVIGLEETIANTMYEFESRQRASATRKIKQALADGYTPKEVLDVVTSSDKWSDEWKENIRKARSSLGDIDTLSTIIKNNPTKEQTVPKGVFPKAARMAGGLLGDLWVMTLGASAGLTAVAPIAGAATVAAGPVTGALVAAAGAGAGAFGLRSTLKSMLDRKIEDGNVKVKDVHKRAMDVFQDSAKEYVFGSIVGLTGGAGRVLGLSPIARWAATTTAMTGGGAAIEKKWPTLEDWVVNGIAIGGFEFADKGARLLQKRYNERRSTIPEEEPVETYKEVIAEVAKEKGEEFDTVTGRFIATDQGPGRRIKQPKQKKPAEGVGIDTELQYEEPTKEPTADVAGEAYYEGNVPPEIERELRAARTAEARDEILTRYKNQMGVDVEEGTGGTVERPIGPTAEQQPGMYTATDMAGMALGELQRRSRGGPDVGVATELAYEKGKKTEVEPTALAGEVGDMADPAALYEIAKGSVKSAKDMEGVFLTSGVDPTKVISWVRKWISALNKVTESEKTPTRKMSPDEIVLWSSDWKAYSRDRGYTEKQIADYQKFLDLYKEGKNLGLSETQMQEVNHLFNQMKAGNKSITQKEMEEVVLTSGIDPTKIGTLIRNGYRTVTRIDGKVYEEGQIPSSALIGGKKIENGYMGEKGQFIPQEIAEKSSTPTFFSGVDITAAPFKKGPSLIKAFVDEAIKSGRFVPYYNRSQGKAIPRRQQSGISDKEPDRPKRDIYRVETYQSPNQTFSRIFDINSNPALDVFPAMMAAAKNTLNMKRWASNVLDKIPDSTKEVIGTMKPIFDKYREVVETFNKNQDAIEFAKKGLRQSKGNVEKMREYQQQIAEAEKELAKLDRPLATMGKEADAAIAKLAEQYSDVRVYLHAARELPPGIKLTPAELDASNRIHQYMRETGAELHKAGIPTLDIEKYMPRIYRALLNDKTGKNVFNTSVPAVMRFMSRCPSDRSWIPSAHAMTKAYIPMSEFKLAYQPFLNRWGKFINTLQEPELKAYMNRWVYENLYRKTDTLMNKTVNAFTMMEYIRIIGGSPSVALKHLSKQVGTWAYFGLTPTVKAEMSMAKVPIQAYMKWKGVKGDYSELHAFQMYNNLQQFIRALDEVPGLEIKHRAMAQLQLLAGNPTIAAEMLDNGVSVMAGIMMGAKKGMTFNQTYRALWDVILNTNFRASWDQPLFQKAAGVRALTMFQMTPYKLFEYKTKLIENAIQNKKDAFGNSEVARLLRYALTVGGITYAARQEGVDVLEWFTHPPFVKDLFKQVKEEPYLVAGGADLSEAPVAQMAHEMKVKGILGGAKTHFKDWGMITKIAKAVRGEYNTEMYKRPEDFILGLRQIESKYIEGAMEKRQELQELRREQDKKIEPLVDKYIMTKDTKYVEKIREFVAPLPKEQQDRIVQHCDNYAKTVGLPDRKWWTTLMSISPEERAELFHKRYKETPQKDRAALELNAMNLDGFATQRFRARIKELGNP